MNLKPKRELVDALLACPTMSNRHTRNSVVQHLPDEIRHNVQRNLKDRVDVLNIVTACLDYSNGMPELLDILQFYESNSIPMQRVQAAWSDFLTSTTAKSSKPRRVTSKKESKARDKYLAIIEADVTNRLKSSIHRARFIDIGSEQSLNSTFLPWLYQGHDTPEQFTSFEEAFESFERRVLLLGAPGAGKTTTLLHIARKLIQEAKDDPNAPIPLLFNLSKYREHDKTPSRRALPFLGNQWPFFGRRTPASEQKKEQTIEQWLIQLTSDTYRFIPKEIVQSWIEGKRVALLLDGLDEVDDQLRINLVLKLNTYLGHDLDITVIICSRIIDYQPLQQNKETHLHLNGAVTLQPLNQRQINAYLEKAQATALRDALPNNAALYELAQTPLTLTMMTLAYGGLAPTDIPANLSLIERRYHLFDTYVDRMMQRQALRETDPDTPFDFKVHHDQPTQYTREQINHYLGWLALRLSERSQTVFPLHKLHSFLDQNREEEQDEEPWRPTDIAYLILPALFTLLIGLLLMPKSLIGLVQAILISCAVGFTSVLYRLLRLKLKKIIFNLNNGLNYFERIGFFSFLVIYFGGIVMGVVTILPILFSKFYHEIMGILSDFSQLFNIDILFFFSLYITPIPLATMMFVLFTANLYLDNFRSQNRVLFVVITVISVLFPIGPMALSRQMNSLGVIIASHRLLERDFMLMARLPGRPLSEMRHVDYDTVLRQVGQYLADVHRLQATQYGYLGAHQPMVPQRRWVEAFAIMWNKLIDDVVAVGHC